MNSSILSIGIALCIISIITRVGPIMIGDFLQKQKWMKKLSKTLPCMILTLLLFHDIGTRTFAAQENLYPALLGIFMTLAAHLWKRQIILSIASGVMTYFLMNYILT